MNAPAPVYLEIIEFIAGGTTPRAVVEFRPSAEAQRKIEDLIAREKEGSLGPEETRAIPSPASFCLSSIPAPAGGAIIFAWMQNGSFPYPAPAKRPRVC